MKLFLLVWFFVLESTLQFNNLISFLQKYWYLPAETNFRSDEVEGCQVVAMSHFVFQLYENYSVNPCIGCVVSGHPGI